MNKQQMIEAGRAEGVSDKVIQRRLIAAGFSENLDTAEDAATYEQRHDAIIERYRVATGAARDAMREAESEATAAMLKLNQEFGVEDKEIDYTPPDLTQDDYKQRCDAIHWPFCWDTAAYPTLKSAEAEFELSCAENFQCNNDDCPNKTPPNNAPGT